MADLFNDITEATPQEAAQGVFPIGLDDDPDVWRRVTFAALRRYLNIPANSVADIREVVNFPNPSTLAEFDEDIVITLADGSTRTISPSNTLKNLVIAALRNAGGNVPEATESATGTVTLARAEDVGDSETDLSRVPTVSRAISLTRRLISENVRSIPEAEASHVGYPLVAVASRPGADGGWRQLTGAGIANDTVDESNLTAAVKTKLNARGTGGGLNQSQVDERVRAGVIDTAETGNTTRWAKDKLPTDTVYDADIAPIRTRGNDNTRAITSADNRIDVLEETAILEMNPGVVFGGNVTDPQGTYHLNVQTPAPIPTAIIAEIWAGDGQNRRLFRMSRGGFTATEKQRTIEFEFTSTFANNLQQANPPGTDSSTAPQGYLTIGRILQFILVLQATGNSEVFSASLDVPVIAKPATAPDVDQTARNAAAAAQATAGDDYIL